MANDINAVSAKVRAILATQLSAADADYWARRIAWALTLTAQFAAAGAAVAIVSAQQGVPTPDTSEADAVDVGLTTLSRKPE